MFSWLCAGGLLLVLAQAPAPSEKPITNFWIYLSETLDAEAAKPVVAADPNVRYPPPRTYAFEAISQLRPAELVRAAVEGIRDARQRLHDQPEERIDLQCRENVQRCLEYFPLLVTQDSDIEPLLVILEDPRGEPVFRQFLMERVTPGLVPRSNFSDYFQESLRRDPERVNKLFEQIATGSAEREATWRMAADAWYRYNKLAFDTWFSSDPNVAAYAAAHGDAAVTPMQLRDTPELSLSPANAPVLAEKTAIFSRMAAALSTQLNPKYNRPIPIKSAAEALIRRMLAEIPFEQPEEIQALLEAPKEIEAPAADATPAIPTAATFPAEFNAPLP